MPRFSIVMPTYNRADAILRAIASVQAQICTDWELIVVDDGSADGTRDRLPKDEPRLRVLSQPNRGVASARNLGLREARGELIAFLDSDDEWLPHHLALADAFFAAHPDEQLLTSELWEDFGRGFVVAHFLVEVRDWYPQTAAQIGSRAFAGRPPDGDPYLRLYQERAPIGDWGAHLAARSGHAGALHYRGHIFDWWRWGWLMAMQGTVLTRAALAAAGPIDETYPIASDFGWLAGLCRRFQTNFLSLPACIKHELAPGQASLGEDHLVTGRHAVRFHEDVLRFHEELFCDRDPGHPELEALRGFRQLLVARAAVLQRDRPRALLRIDQSVRSCPSGDAKALRLLIHAVEDPALLARIFDHWQRAALIPVRLRERLKRAIA